MDELEKFRKEAEFRRLSPRTIETYISCLKKFFDYYKKDYRKVTKKDVREFLEELQRRNASGSTIHIYLNAIKFFFEETMRRNMHINIKYSKRPVRLPEVLTKEEIKKLLENISNNKHKIMISLMYASGLRVSELVNLRLGDLNLKEMYGFVRQGKGGKDRIFVIPKKLERVFIQMWAGRDQKEFLFVTNKGEKYDTRSIGEIVNKAAKLSGIAKYKNVHPHTLRHSFATHLIENGCSLNEVQALLGHKSPETSMIYVHMASPTLLNIKSPLDEL